MITLPPVVAAALDAQCAAREIAAVERVECTRFSVVTVASKGAAVDSFTALNLSAQTIWHFMGSLVRPEDTARVQLGAKLWEIWVHYTSAAGVRAKTTFLIWED